VEGQVRIGGDAVHQAGDLIDPHKAEIGIEDGCADWSGPDYSVEKRNQLGSVLRDRRGRVGRTLCGMRGAL
jgi:hypothetical protein